jgi:hypothetical protein
MKRTLYWLLLITLVVACSADVQEDLEEAFDKGNASKIISLTSPIKNATDVPLSSSITITFNEDIEPSTITTANITVRDSDGNNVGGVFSYDNKVVTFTLSNDLDYSTIYTVTVGTGVKNSVGDNILNSSFSWSFTTVPAPVSSVSISTSPTNGATYVPVSDNM